MSNLLDIGAISMNTIKNFIPLCNDSIYTSEISPLSIKEQSSNEVTGGSWISQTGEEPTPGFGTKTYYLARFLPKTALK